MKQHILAIIFFLWVSVMTLGAAEPSPAPDAGKTIGVVVGEGKVSFEQGLVIAFLVGLVLLLMRVVDYFLQQRRERSSESDPTPHTSSDVSKLDVILDKVSESYELKSKVLESVQEIRQLISQNINNCTMCSQRIERILSATEKMLDMHDRTDESGVPVWYMPRTWFEHQREILAALAKVAETQRDTLLVLDRISDRIENLEDHQ